MSTRRVFLASLVSLAAVGTLPGMPPERKPLSKPQRSQHRLIRTTETTEMLSADGKFLSLVRKVVTIPLSG